jgi:hypothetical protein
MMGKMGLFCFCERLFLTCMIYKPGLKVYLMANVRGTFGTHSRIRDILDTRKTAIGTGC